MSKLPRQPPSVDTLRASSPTWATLPVASLLWRVFPRGGPYPTTWDHFRTWGPSRARFDPHLPGPDGTGSETAGEQARGVLYAAEHFDTCLAEFFQARRTIDRGRDHVTVVAFAPTRPLRLLDLWDAWSTRIGASGILSSGPHAATRAWARVLYEAFPEADGLRYESAMLPNTPAFAVWERARDGLPATPQLHRALEDPDLWIPVHNAARRLGYRLL